MQVFYQLEKHLLKVKIKHVLHASGKTRVFLSCITNLTDVSIVLNHTFRNYCRQQYKGIKKTYTLLNVNYELN